MKSKLFLFFFVVVAFVACTKDIQEQNELPTLSNRLQKKWIVSSATNGNFEFIEFLPEDIYIIRFKDGKIKTGAYSIDSARQQILIPFYGTFIFTMVNPYHVDFNFKPRGSKDSILVNSFAAQPVENSSNTNLLCHKWLIYKYTSPGGPAGFETVNVPSTLPDPYGFTIAYADAVFSRYGTLLLTQIMENPISVDTNYWFQNWRWANTAQNALNYYDNTDSDIFNIAALSNKELEIEEDGDRTFLRR